MLRTYQPKKLQRKKDSAPEAHREQGSGITDFRAERSAL